MEVKKKKNGGDYFLERFEDTSDEIIGNSPL